MKQLKLGIVGISSGNGHPYSWAAIFNGYNDRYMRSCPYPVIYQYLSKRKFPEEAIAEGFVTHIWTQDTAASRHIAAAANIPHIANNLEDLIGEVDAVLLARDDAALHYQLSKPFLLAGLPVYIDKPLATTVHMAQEILALQQYEGQVFTCSALRFASEFNPPREELNRIGTILHVDACVMKDWEKYSMHIIDPVLHLVGHQGEITSIEGLGKNNRRIVHVTWESGLQACFATLGDVPVKATIRLFGSESFMQMVYQDSFSAFKNALLQFVNIVLGKKEPQATDLIMDAVRIVEEGGKDSLTDEH